MNCAVSTGSPLSPLPQVVATGTTASPDLGFAATIDAVLAAPGVPAIPGATGRLTVFAGLLKVEASPAPQRAALPITILAPSTRAPIADIELSLAPGDDGLTAPPQLLEPAPGAPDHGGLQHADRRMPNTPVQRNEPAVPRRDVRDATAVAVLQVATVALPVTSRSAVDNVALMQAPPEPEPTHTVPLPQISLATDQPPVVQAEVAEVIGRPAAPVEPAEAPGHVKAQARSLFMADRSAKPVKAALALAPPQTTAPAVMAPVAAEPTTASAPAADDGENNDEAAPIEPETPMRTSDLPALAGGSNLDAQAAPAVSPATPSTPADAVIAGLATAAPLPAHAIALPAVPPKSDRQEAKRTTVGATTASQAELAIGRPATRTFPDDRPTTPTMDPAAAAPAASVHREAPSEVATKPLPADRDATEPNSAFQAPAQLASAPAAKPAAATSAVPVVAARAGQIGQDIAVHIAQRIAAGGDELVVRLIPADLGRIEVRMSFEDQGSLRAVIVADSPVVFDMLRRESADLTRALGDAGVRSDAQSLRFQTDTGSSGGNGGQPRSPWLDGDGKYGHGPRQADRADAAEHAPFRQFRTSGRYDLLA